MTVVETASGVVRGAVRGGVSTWRGIPFASAPRFRPPLPVEPWTVERDATRFGPVAIQSRDPRAAMMSGVTDAIETGEDCLVLNITSPAADARRRPVVVWIHGGAFIMGSGSQPMYDGTSFAVRHDVVVVTINYRLGLLGLLYLGDLLGDDYAAGNVALLDQIAALCWVRDNIARFGGDPDAVTVMGESAGAISIAYLMAIPSARGTFHRAILQSGASGLTTTTRAAATATARAICADLGIAAAELAELDVERLIAAQLRASQSAGFGPVGPHVDGVTVPRPPIELVRDGAGSRVPVLLGSNRDEWTLFDVFLGEAVTQIAVASLRTRLGTGAEELHAAYRAVRSDRDAARAWVDLIGDAVFRIPMIRLAEAQSRYAPVWMYRFDWASSVFTDKLGSAHGLELPFTWNAVEQPLAKFLFGDDASAKPLATAMHAAWAAFIGGGAPAAAGLPAWPRYDATTRATMILGRDSRVVEDPGGPLRALWP